MLKVFEEFKDRLDRVMLKAFGHRIVLWGVWLYRTVSFLVCGVLSWAVGGLYY